MNLGWFQTKRGEVHAHKDPELPSDCEREPMAETFDEAAMKYVGIDVDKAYEDGMVFNGLNRAEMDYIANQIDGAVQTALQQSEERHAQDLAGVARAISETRSSNGDAFRNIALQWAINCHLSSDGPVRSKEIVESAREFHSFLKGYEG